MPRLVAALVPRYASLIELATVYGVEDAHDLLEIAFVAAYNHNRRARYDAAKRALDR